MYQAKSNSNHQMNTIIDLKILADHPEQLARVTQALARAYYNNVLKQKDINQLSEAYGKAFRFCPNYRLILKEKPGFEKYRHINRVYGEILSLPLLNSEQNVQESDTTEDDSSNEAG